METTYGKRSICRIFDDFNELFSKTPQIGGKSPSKPEEKLTKFFKNVANTVYCNRRGRKINAVAALGRRSTKILLRSRLGSNAGANEKKRE